MTTEKNRPATLLHTFRGVDGKANHHWMGSDGFVSEFGNDAPADVAVYGASVAAGSVCCPVFSSGGDCWWEES